MTLLTASDLTVAFGRHRVLEGIDFSVDRGELLGLVGPNGAGKTTLLRTVLGLVDRTSGDVLIDDSGIGDLAVRERARRIAYLPQIPTVHWPIAVRRLVALGRLPHLGPWQSPSAEDEDAIDDALAAADISELQDRAHRTLSGGERRLATLARALAVGADLLLADEPVAALDPGHQLQVMTLFHNLTRCHRAAIVVLHDLTLATRFCDRLILLHEGRIHAQGCPHEVLDKDNLATVYGVRARFGQPPDRYIVPWERV